MCIMYTYKNLYALFEFCNQEKLMNLFKYCTMYSPLFIQKWHTFLYTKMINHSSTDHDVNP